MNKMQKENNRIYILDDDDNVIAEITWYDKKDDVIVADSTYVDEKLRGRGIAKKLLDELASYARSNDLKIMAQCEYVKAAFSRYSEYEDVIHLE